MDAAVNNAMEESAENMKSVAEFMQGQNLFKPEVNMAYVEHVQEQRLEQERLLQEQQAQEATRESHHQVEFESLDLAPSF